jgi:bacterioferritin-associated ferredoxin
MDNYDLNQLLRPRKICLCFGLSKQDLIEAIEKNQIKTFEELQNLTKCSTNCGTCENEIKKLLKEQLSQKIPQK